MTERLEIILTKSALMNIDNYQEAVQNGIKYNYFNNQYLASIWKSIGDVSKKYGVTPVTVAGDMYPNDQSLQEEAIQYIESLISTELQIEDYTYALTEMKEHIMRRELRAIIDVANMNLHSDMKTDEIVQSLVDKVFSLESSDQTVIEYDAIQIINETSKDIKERMLGENKDGVKSGIETLDEEIGNFHFNVPNLIVGRPGHGKTTLMINCYTNNFLNEEKPLFITLEMPGVHLMFKIISIISKIPVNRILSPKTLTDSEKTTLEYTLIELASKEFYIVDALSLTPNELGSLLIKYAKKGSKVAYIDYIQLLKTAAGKTPDNAADFRSVFKDVREMLRLVSRYGDLAPVFGVQAGRDLEKRPVEERGPMMSDLEWSSSLEQDAALVIGVMNREKYEGEECEFKNQLFLNFPKGRYKHANSMSVAFMGAIQYITDLNNPTRIMA